MGMNPFGVNLDAFGAVNLDAMQMMSNPLLRGFVSQQEEEEEPVGFWNKIASRMPGYNLPGMQNDMKRQALNEALIMAGASMMQNAGSGNIGSALAEALTKGMGTYKEGVASQYKGLEEQRKREMEDAENAREARRLGISEEQLRIMQEGEKRAQAEFDRESGEWNANAPIREGTREEQLRQIEANKNISMEEVYSILTPEEVKLVENTRVMKGAAAAQAIAIELYKDRKSRDITSEYYKARSSTGRTSNSSLLQQYKEERRAAGEATKAAAKTLAEIEEVMSKTGTAAKKKSEIAAIIAASPFNSVEEAEEAKLALSQFDEFAKKDPDYSQFIRFGSGAAEDPDNPGSGEPDIKVMAKEIAGRLLRGETPEVLYGEYPEEAVDDVVKYLEMKKIGQKPGSTPSVPTPGLPGMNTDKEQSSADPRFSERISGPVKTWARPASDAITQMSEWQRMLASLFGSLDDEEGGFEISIPEAVRGKRR